MFFLLVFSQLLLCLLRAKHKKGRGAAKAFTPKRRAKQPGCKSQHLPTYSSTTREDVSKHKRTVTHPVETETSLNTAMDMLVDISSRLSATEHFVDEARDDKPAEADHRDQSLSHICTTPAPEGTPTVDEPQQAALQSWPTSWTK